MKYKLIATDLDGTLINDDMVVSALDEKAIAEFTKLGGIYVPTSGRALYEFPECIFTNPYVRYLSYSNGSAVFDKIENRDIIKNKIPKETAKLVFDIIFKDDALIVLHSSMKPWISQKVLDENLFEYYEINEYFTTLFSTYTSIEDFEAFCYEEEEIESVTIFYKNHDDEKRTVEALSKISGISITSSSIGNIEISSDKAGKGNALRELLEILKVEKDAVIAVGDHLNDASLLSAAGTGLAVANATDELKKVASDVICRYDENIFNYIMINYVKPTLTFKDKVKRHRLSIVFSAICVAVAAVILSLALGFGNSYTAIGYVGNAGWDSWSAKYSYLDGKKSHTIHPDTDEVKFSFTTESGEISVYVYDASGNEIYKAVGINGNKEFAVEVDGNIKVKIEATEHKGSFIIGD